MINSLKIKYINNKLLYLLLGLSLFISGCATNTPNAMKMTSEKLKTIKFLSDNELKTLFEGNDLEGVSLKNKTKFNMSYKKNGTFFGTYKDGEKTTSGKWKIHNQQKCNTYPSGKQRCRSFYKDGNKIFAYDKKRNLITAYIKIN